MLKNLLFLIFLPSLLFSQQKENKEAYILFDDIVGQKNLEINSGVKYIQKFRTLQNEHQFLHENFSLGTIHYKKQVYYDVPMMYDLYNDDLIVKINSLYERHSLILNKNEVSYFILSKRKFVNYPNYGFYEELYAAKNQSLLKKNKKTLKNKIVGKSRYSKFTSLNSYFLSKDGKLHSIAKKRDWLKLYPELKPQIKVFYKSRQAQLKSFPDSFMIELFKLCTK